MINILQNDSLGLVLTNPTPKGFRTINPKDDRYATLSWGLFDEIHETKLIERYNNTLYNTKTGKITKFVACDTLYNKYQIDAAVFAWQVDPLVSKMPNWSPYAAFANNPIYFIDTDGKIFVTYITLNEKNESTGETNKVDYKIIFNGTTTTMQQVQNGVTFGKITPYTGVNKFVNDIVDSYNYIVENDADINGAMKKMAEMNEEIEIKDRANMGEYSNGIIKYDFGKGTKINSTDNTVDGIQSPALGFWSEVYHGYIDKIDLVKKNEFKSDNSTNDQEEEYVHVEIEGKVIDALKKKNPNNNEAKRTTYGDGWKNVKTKGVTSTERK